MPAATTPATAPKPPAVPQVTVSKKATTEPAAKPNTKAQSCGKTWEHITGKGALGLAIIALIVLLAAAILLFPPATAAIAITFEILLITAASALVASGALAISYIAILSLQKPQPSRIEIAHRKLKSDYEGLKIHNKKEEAAAHKEITALTNQIDQLKKQAVQGSSEGAPAAAPTAAPTHEIHDRIAKLEQERAEHVKQLEQLSHHEAALKTSQKSLQDLQVQMDQLHVDAQLIAQQKQQIETLTQRLHETEQQRQTIQAKHDTLVSQGQPADVQHEITAKSDEITRLRGELETQSKKHAKDVQQFQKDIASVRQQLTDTEAARVGALQEYDHAKRTVATLTGQLQQKTNDYNRMLEAANHDHETVTGQLSAKTQEAADLRQELDDLGQRAGQHAEQIGAELQQLKDANRQLDEAKAEADAQLQRAQADKAALEKEIARLKEAAAHASAAQSQPLKPQPAPQQTGKGAAQPQDKPAGGSAAAPQQPPSGPATAPHADSAVTKEPAVLVNDGRRGSADKEKDSAGGEHTRRASAPGPTATGGQVPGTPEKPREQRRAPGTPGQRLSAGAHDLGVKIKHGAQHAVHNVADAFGCATKPMQEPVDPADRPVKQPPKTAADKTAADTGHPAGDAAHPAADPAHPAGNVAQPAGDVANVAQPAAGGADLKVGEHSDKAAEHQPAA